MGWVSHTPSCHQSLFTTTYTADADHPAIRAIRRAGRCAVEVDSRRRGECGGEMGEEGGGEAVPEGRACLLMFFLYTAWRRSRDMCGYVCSSLGDMMHCFENDTPISFPDVQHQRNLKLRRKFNEGN